MSKKTTRNALFTSLMSLLLCASMLVGTTFAWFTDSVTSSGNIIKSGVLDVEMTWAETNSANEADWKDASTGAIFDYQLWEPGFTQTRYVKIANVGNLDFKYKLTIVPAFTPAAGEANLADVIDAYLVPVGNAPADRVEADAIIASGNGTSLTNLIADPDGAAYGTMLDGTSETYCIILHMQETAGNEYQNLSVGDGFSVHLLATQLASEADSFCPDYDVESEYTALPAAGAADVTDKTQSAYTVLIKSADDNSGNVEKKAAAATVPAAAVAPGVEKVTFTISEGTASSNITILDGQTAESYEIKAEGLADTIADADAVKMEMFVGFDKNVVAVYHKDEAIANGNWGYNPADGIVWFKTTSFSPFTVIFASEPIEVVPPAGDGSDFPTATVSRVTEWEGAEIEWKGYGGLYPSDLNQTLEVVYSFAATDDSESVKNSPYRFWNADFYVSVNKDLGEQGSQVVLGGNYGSFGWVGFDNPAEYPIPANTKVPLLGSMTNSGESNWTYEDVVNLVDTFMCGVAHKDHALDGATFTVELRIMDPESDAYHVVETIDFVFPTCS